MGTALDRFRLDGRVAVITGGAGLLGAQHAEVIAEAGGTPVIWDIDGAAATRRAQQVQARHGGRCDSVEVDITAQPQVRRALQRVLEELGRVDILINNAANDPKAGGSGRGGEWTRFERFSPDVWNQDLAVGLTGAFLCSQAIGTHMAEHGGGVILNVASDLAVVAPDQRIYREPGLLDAEQPVKPVTYSVLKHGLIGLTKYLATYWASSGVRVNAISPGGVYNGQPEAFVRNLSQLIPMGRMAERDEYKAAVLFLVSDASSYMTGANVIVDGGRTCW